MSRKLSLQFLPPLREELWAKDRKFEEELYKRKQVGSDQPVANRTYRWFLYIYAASHPQVLH